MSRSPSPGARSGSRSSRSASPDGPASAARLESAVDLSRRLRQLDPRCGPGGGQRRDPARAASEGSGAGRVSARACSAIPRGNGRLGAVGAIAQDRAARDWRPGRGAGASGPSRARAGARTSPVGQPRRPRRDRTRVIARRAPGSPASAVRTTPDGVGGGQPVVPDLVLVRVGLAPATAPLRRSPSIPCAPRGAANWPASRRAAFGVLAQTTTPETGRSSRWTVPR